MNAVILTRGTDKAAQKLQCMIYAHFKDYNVVEVVGSTQELSKMVANEKVDVILMTHISRLTRKKTEYDNIQSMLRGYGVTIELAN